MSIDDPHTLDFDTFRAHLETEGADTLLLPPDQTIRSDIDSADLVTSQALRPLPELQISDTADSLSSDLVALKILGEGGMGLVRLARQTALDREVAVKTTRQALSPAATRVLLQEAYTTGFLEHPNIIPIYNVGRTPDGAPLIVMKRIEGTSWRDLLFDDERSLDLFDHIEILLHVCDALRFAHSRGVIHRDIKLDNVMVGPFNEVYLLDWGIAASIRGDRPLLPHIKDSTGLTGTPNYMAPEMALQHTDQQDERTDVYLLGATLHHLLTGEPRHSGAKLLRVLFHATQSAPVEYNPSIPTELADIANRACHPNPEERFPSVEAFQQELRGFLEHRQSIALTETTDHLADELLTSLDFSEPDPAQVHELFSECRFGYRQALRMWPGNTRAADRLRQCQIAMTRFFIHTENPDAAQSLLDELQDPPTYLSDQLQILRDRLQQRHDELARLQKMERALDPGRTHRGRSLFALFLGLFWGATTFYAAFNVHHVGLDEAEQLANNMRAGFRNLLVIPIVLFFFRRHIVTNKANRNLVLVLVTTILAVCFLRWTAWRIQADIVLAHAADLTVYTLALFTIGLMTDRRIVFMSLFFAIGAVGGSLLPHVQIYFEAFATVLVFLGFAWIWWPRDKANEEPTPING